MPDSTRPFFVDLTVDPHELNDRQHEQQCQDDGETSQRLRGKMIAFATKVLDFIPKFFDQAIRVQSFSGFHGFSR